jgi:hypothetical protein
MFFIATGGIFNLMGFSMAGDREAIENPIKNIL